MQVFPTKESLELSGFQESSKSNNGGSAAGTGTGTSGGVVSTMSGFGSPVPSYHTSSLYLKTLMVSLKDQQYLLTPVELSSRQFQWVHKIVFYTTISIQSLSRDMVQLSYLGITGLNKLIPKENNSHKFTSNISKGNMTFLMSAPSYMVATNSMSQKLEETLLTDIKMEINSNKWTRFQAVADVVSISLQIGHESVKRLTKVASHIDEKSPPQSIQGAHIASGPSGVSVHGSSSALTASSNNIHAGGSDKYPELSFVGETHSTSGSNLGGVHGVYGPNGVGSIPNPFENRTRAARSAPFRANSLKEHNSEAEYSKSKRVSANIMSQLLLDWLETRANCVFEAAHIDALLCVWKKHYPDFGSKLTFVMSFICDAKL